MAALETIQGHMSSVDRGHSHMAALERTQCHMTALVKGHIQINIHLYTAYKSDTYCCVHSDVSLPSQADGRLSHTM